MSTRAVIALIKIIKHRGYKPSTSFMLAKRSSNTRHVMMWLSSRRNI